MADISMCLNGEKCKLKDKCYRWVAEPTPNYQAMASFFKEEEESKCPHFWEVKSSEDLKELNEYWW